MYSQPEDALLQPVVALRLTVIGFVMQGRGQLVCALKSVGVVPDRQRALNPRMADGSFEKVLQLPHHYRPNSVNAMFSLLEKACDALFYQ